jgi:hypothetical protein
MIPPPPESEGDPMLPVQVLTASPELLDVCEMAQKAKAFDLVATYRHELAAITKETRALAGKRGGGGSVMAQYLGRKMQIERAIEAVFLSFGKAP